MAKVVHVQLIGSNQACDLADARPGLAQSVQAHREHEGVGARQLLEQFNQVLAQWQLARPAVLRLGNECRLVGEVDAVPGQRHSFAAACSRHQLEVDEGLHQRDMPIALLGCRLVFGARRLDDVLASVGRAGFQ